MAALVGGLLLNRLAIRGLEALPLGITAPDWIAPIAGTAKWWAPVLVGAILLIAQLSRRR